MAEEIVASPSRVSRIFVDNMKPEGYVVGHQVGSIERWCNDARRGFTESRDGTEQQVTHIVTLYSYEEGKEQGPRICFPHDKLAGIEEIPKGKFS